jgi:hypothetical protein
MLLCILLNMSLIQAQPAPGKQQESQGANTIGQDVLISIQQEQVRITAQKAVAEMQLQIFDKAGQPVYDSGAVTGPELSWFLGQAGGETVNSGVYAYTLSVKEEGAETARVRRGYLIVDRANGRDGQTDRIWITGQNDSDPVAELPVTRNERVTIAGASAPSEQENAKDAEGTTRNEESELKQVKNRGTAELVSGTTGQIAMFTSATDLGDSVITEQNGNIGIGTLNPFSKFHVRSGPVDYLPPRLESPGSDTFAAGWDFYHGRNGVGYVGVPDGRASIAPGEMLVYGTGTTSLWAGGQRSITIAPNGNVGIGIDSPFASTRLHVEGGGTALSATSANGFSMISTTTNGIGLVSIAGPNGFAGYFDGLVRLNGSMIPTVKGSFDLGAPGLYWRWIYVANIIQTSDARLKKDVANLRYGLRELMQLRPVTYDWKDHSNGQRQLGLIAQETEQIIPEVVTRQEDPEKPLGINYTALVPVVIKAVQQQQGYLVALKGENEELKRQNADLESRLAALEQMVQQVVGATAASSVSQGESSLQKQQREPAQR